MEERDNDVARKIEIAIKARAQFLSFEKKVNSWKRLLRLVAALLLKFSHRYGPYLQPVHKVLFPLLFFLPVVC